MNQPANAAAAAFARGDEVEYHFTVPGLPSVGTLTNLGVVTDSSQVSGVTVAWYGSGASAVFSGGGGPYSLFSDVELPLVLVQGRISELELTGEHRAEWLAREGK